MQPNNHQQLKLWVWKWQLVVKVDRNVVDLPLQLFLHHQGITILIFFIIFVFFFFLFTEWFCGISIHCFCFSNLEREKTPPKPIYLEGALPSQCELLVTDSETQAEKSEDDDDAPVVLSGKMTLSLISLDQIPAVRKY